MNPLVSVIIAVYNGEKYILEAIKSVMTQTYQNIELIIVNDGSTDATATLIQKHYPSIKYVFQSNQGQCRAINHGLSLVTGEYVSFLDADDVYIQDKINLQSNVLRSNPEIDMVFGSVEEFVCPTMIDRIKLSDQRQAYSTHLAGSGLFRTTCFDRVGLFDLQWEVAGFVDWYMRAKEYSLTECLIPQLIIRRRIHGNNLGFTHRHKQVEYLRIVKAALMRRNADKMVNG